MIKVNSPRVCELDSWLNIHRSDNQETMRYDTVIPHLFREATRDEVIPLTAKVFCRSGNVIEHLPIPRGTQIIISDVAYHRWACQITPLYSEFDRHSSGTRTYGETTQISGGRADGWMGRSSHQEPIRAYGPICAPQEYPPMSAT